MLSTELCHQSSVHRYLLNKGKQVIAFGVDGSRVSQSEGEDKNLKVHFMKQIKKSPFDQAWGALLKQLVASEAKVHVSFNLETV